MRIAVIGAGHAGVEAAAASAAAGADAVVVYSAESSLPYFRPRLVAMGFGQANQNAIQLHPANWYAERRIALRLNTPARRLKLEPLAVITDGGEEAADAIIVACGATPMRPPAPGLDDPRVHVLWNKADATALHAALRSDGQLVILGGGILGIEAALRAIEARQSVTIVERLDHLMPSQFGPRAAAVLLEQLTARGIRIHTGRTLTRVESRTEDKSLGLVLDDGTHLPCDYMLLSAGARPALDLAQTSALRTRRGIVVTTTLQTSAARIFAAGDVAELPFLTRCAVREATAQGHLAGTNAVAAVHGQPGAIYKTIPLPLTYKAPGFEVNAIGLADGPGCETQILETRQEHAFRALILQNGVLVGVQMIGTREGFDEYAAKVQPAHM